jgi:hypothetical protein
MQPPGRHRIGFEMEAGMSKKVVLACAMVLGATTAASAVDCRSAPDLTAKGKWSVETVGGKICWFQGDSGTPKEELRWPGGERIVGTKPVDTKKPAAAPAAEKAQPKKVTTAPTREDPKKKQTAATSKREQPEPKNAASASRREQPEPKKLASLAKPERAQPETLAAAPAEKIQCRPEADNSKPGHWRWRMIDNKQCWFVSERTVPREWLEWPSDERGKPTQDDANLKPQPVEEEPSPDSTQLVNQESGGDLEFIVPGAWFATPLSIDLKVGAQFLTHVSITLWPLVGDTPTQYLRTADFAFGR